MFKKYFLKNNMIKIKKKIENDKKDSNDINPINSTNNYETYTINNWEVLSFPENLPEPYDSNIDLIKMNITISYTEFFQFHPEILDEANKIYINLLKESSIVKTINNEIISRILENTLNNDITKIIFGIIDYCIENIPYDVLYNDFLFSKEIYNLAYWSTSFLNEPNKERYRNDILYYYSRRRLLPKYHITLGLFALFHFLEKFKLLKNF